MIAHMFRPIGSVTGWLGAIVAGLVLLAFAAPFIPDATWWLS
jgi:hypothetical protein